MLKNEKILIISASFMIMSCSVNKNDLLGKYSFTGDNVIDTLIIKQDTYFIKFMINIQNYCIKGKINGN